MGLMPETPQRYRSFYFLGLAAHRITMPSQETGHGPADTRADAGDEGVVGKRTGSVYRSGERPRDWMKIRQPGAAPPERFKR